MHAAAHLYYNDQLSCCNKAVLCVCQYTTSGRNTTVMSMWRRVGLAALTRPHSLEIQTSADWERVRQDHPTSAKCFWNWNVRIGAFWRGGSRVEKPTSWKLEKVIVWIISFNLEGGGASEPLKPRTTNLRSKHDWRKGNATQFIWGSGPVLRNLATKWIQNVFSNRHIFHLK